MPLAPGGSDAELGVGGARMPSPPRAAIIVPAAEWTLPTCRAGACRWKCAECALLSKRAPKFPGGNGLEIRKLGWARGRLPWEGRASERLASQGAHPQVKWESDPKFY